MNYTAHDLYEIAKKAAEDELAQIMRLCHTAASNGKTSITVYTEKTVLLTMLKNLGIKSKKLADNHYEITFN